MELPPLAWITLEENRFYKYCVKTLWNESRYIHRENKRRSDKESLFSELDEYMVNNFTSYDDYNLLYNQLEVAEFVLHIENDVLYEALKELPDDKRNIIVFSVGLGMTDRAIGEKLHIPTRNVCYQKHAILNKLRKRMKGK